MILSSAVPLLQNFNLNYIFWAFVEGFLFAILGIFLLKSFADKLTLVGGKSELRPLSSFCNNSFFTETRAAVTSGDNSIFSSIKDNLEFRACALSYNCWSQSSQYHGIAKIVLVFWSGRGDRWPASILYNDHLISRHLVQSWDLLLQQHSYFCCC